MAILSWRAIACGQLPTDSVRKKSIELRFHRFPIAPVSLQARPDDRLGSRFFSHLSERRITGCKERFVWLPVDKCAEIKFVIRKVLQLRSGNNGIKALRGCPRAFSAGCKFSDQGFSIVAANPERNNTGTIAEHGC